MTDAQSNSAQDLVVPAGDLGEPPRPLPAASYAVSPGHSGPSDQARTDASPPLPEIPRSPATIAAAIAPSAHVSKVEAPAPRVQVAPVERSRPAAPPDPAALRAAAAAAELAMRSYPSYPKAPVPPPRTIFEQSPFAGPERRRPPEPKPLSRLRERPEEASVEIVRRGPLDATENGGIGSTEPAPHIRIRPPSAMLSEAPSRRGPFAWLRKTLGSANGRRP